MREARRDLSLATKFRFSLLVFKNLRLQFTALVIISALCWNKDVKFWQEECLFPKIFGEQWKTKKRRNPKLANLSNTHYSVLIPWESEWRLISAVTSGLPSFQLTYIPKSWVFWALPGACGCSVQGEQHVSSDRTTLLNCCPYPLHEKVFSCKRVNDATPVERTPAACRMFGYITRISVLHWFVSMDWCLTWKFKLSICKQRWEVFIIYVSSGKNNLEGMGDGLNLVNCFIKGGAAFWKACPGCLLSVQIIYY